MTKLNGYDDFFLEILRLKPKKDSELRLEFVRALNSMLQLCFFEQNSPPARFRDYLQTMMNEYYKSINS